MLTDDLLLKARSAVGQRIWPWAVLASATETSTGYCTHVYKHSFIYLRHGERCKDNMKRFGSSWEDAQSRTKWRRKIKGTSS